LKVSLRDVLLQGNGSAACFSRVSEVNIKGDSGKIRKHNLVLQSLYAERLVWKEGKHLGSGRGRGLVRMAEVDDNRNNKTMNQWISIANVNQEWRN